VKNTPDVAILRWGHRPVRDARLTAHVALTARALGAKQFILTDTTDPKLMETVTKITQNWGGPFSFDMGIPWKKAIRNWRDKGGIVVHLTAYGENIQTSNVIGRIRKTGKKVLVIVGSQKVPRRFFSEEVSDFNVAVGNQPHSECASLAVFLDRFFMGVTLGKSFEKARMRIVPQKHGKKIVSLGRISHKEI
jgi:tRNA (cytidine56-2'-O)-methyltransferase